jgi:hypothetical protein
VSGWESVRTYPASVRRPDDFPAELPFVPRAAVEIRMRDDACIMSWYGVARPFDLVQQLIGTSASSGWSRTDELVAPPRSVRFRRGIAERLIDVLQAGPFAAVTLTQRERP